MYKFGICDDDRNFCMRLEKILKQCAKEEGIYIETQRFLRGEEYLDFMEKNMPMDILFLDIELEEIDGVQVGHKMREQLGNEATQIVYVSANEEYAMRLFKNRPMDFLVKPIQAKEVKRVLAEYLRIYSKSPIYFNYQTGKYFYQILERAIMYFWSEGKKIHIAADDGKSREFYGKMSDVENKLQRQRFCTVHKSFIVNFEYVAEFKPKELVMADGNVIPISQRLRKKVQEEVFNWKMIQRQEI